MSKRWLLILFLGLVATAAVLPMARAQAGGEEDDEGFEDGDAEDLYAEEGDDEYEEDEGYEEGAEGEAGAGADAGGQQVVMDPETGRPASHPDVQIVHVLPGHEDNKLPLGKPIDSLFGIVNKGDKDVVLMVVDGSIAMTHDFSFTLHNFTRIGYNRTVHGGEGEGSFHYRFFLSPQLEPEEYTVAMTAYYTVGGVMHSSAIFNSTVGVYSTTSELDAQTIFSTISGIAVAAAILVTLWRATAPVSARGAREAAAAKARALGGGDSAEDDYMASYAGPGGAARKGGKGKGKGKGKSD